MKNQAIAYCRVSSKEQEETGYSLPAQEKLLKEYAQRKDLVILKVFSVAESASGSKQRKVFSEMISYLNKNKIPNMTLCREFKTMKNKKNRLISVIL